jgi:hypothetical protein
LPNRRTLNSIRFYPGLFLGEKAHDPRGRRILRQL